MGIKVSRHTVRRRLGEAGLFRFRPVLTPLHKKMHLEARLEFCLTHVDLGPEFFDLLLFSDEVKIEIFGRNDRRFVCRIVGTAYDPRHTIPTVKHGGE